jgi:hypothetical protein
MPELRCCAAEMHDDGRPVDDVALVVAVELDEWIADLRAQSDSSSSVDGWRG